MWDGGFLFAAIEHIIQKKDFSNFDFYDISNSISKSTKMIFMFEFSIDNPNVIIQDSIAKDIQIKYGFIMTNPPFGSQGGISDKKYLRNTTLVINLMVEYLLHKYQISYLLKK